MIQDEIISLVASHVSMDENEITTDMALEDFNIDSLDIFDIVMEIEDKYNVEIPEDLLEKMTSIDDLIHFLKEQLELD